MSFDEDRKRTPEELVRALRACATMGAECEQCEFFEADTPRGYNPCHESLLLTQAANYIEGQITKVVSSKHAAEPERKIIQCADCKWWDRLEEGYPYGFCLACRSGTHTERWDISIYRQSKFDFYCADAEPKEEDDEETR